VVNSHVVCDPTIQQPGFNLPRQQWSLLNRFCVEQGHCGACRRKRRLTDTDLCPCGETQTMSHIVKSCPLTKLNGGLSRLHYADEGAVSWLTSYGSWHAYEKKKWVVSQWHISTKRLFRAIHGLYINHPILYNTSYHVSKYVRCAHSLIARNVMQNVSLFGTRSKIDRDTR